MNAAALAVVHQGPPPTVEIWKSLHQVHDEAVRYAAARRLPRTIEAYQSAWAQFETWARAHGLAPLIQAEGALPLYVAHLANLRRAWSTVSSRYVGSSRFATRRPDVL